MKQRALQKEKTRKHILKVAQKTLASRPFRDFTTAAIAAEAGVSHGTIFSHFSTRDALLTAVTARICGIIEKGINEFLTEESKLEDLLLAHLHGLQNCERSYMRLVLNMGSLPQKAILLIRHHHDGIGKRFVKAFESEPETRELKPGLLLATWLGLINYTMSFRRRFAERGSVTRNTGPRLVAHMMSMVK